METRQTYAIITFGCQMNERDSETIAGLLGEMGYEQEVDRIHADALIINTCSVRENADNRFFGTLGQIKKIKMKRPGVLVGVCGCMAQQRHIVDAIKEKYPWVDIIFGTHNIHRLPKLIEKAVSENQRQVEVLEDGGEIVEGLPAKRRHAFKAFVNIIYGCGNFCAFCVVPYTRGSERSREPEEILHEAKLLAEGGVKEITLLGQNVNSYKSGEAGFAELLRQLNEISGLRRIRFMTSHPKDLSDAIIGALRDCEKLCDHIHLPVQAGSNPILKRMNRRYTKEDYLLLISKLRAARPAIAITTDIIAGFPGETEGDFEETLDLVRTIEFDSAFTFLYSIRKGTSAEYFEPQVPEDVKHERFNRLVELQNSVSMKKNQAQIGRIEEVLVEGGSKKDSNMLTGRTSAFKSVFFVGGAELAGKIIPVKITGAKTFSLYGELI